MSTLAVLHALLTALGTAAVLFLPAGVNTRRRSRQQQYMMPAIAILYGLLALVVVYRFNAWLVGRLDKLFSLLPFLRSLSNPGSSYLLQNAALVLVFVFVKLVFSLVARRYFTGSQFLGSDLVRAFYDFDAPAGRWFLQARWGQTRKLMRVLAYGSIGAASLYVFALSIAPTWPGFAAIAFPGLAAVIVAEFFYALDGVTYTETASTLAGERDDAERVANYAQLRQIFTEESEEQILDQGVDLSGPTAVSSHQAISELLLSAEPRDRVYGEFFERLKQSGKTVDENLMHASVGLLSGKSTLINDPFYRDLTDYLVFPAYAYLLLGKKVLVVSGRDSAAEEMAQWVREGLQEISGVPGLWKVDLLKNESEPTADVGILRAADLHDLSLLEKHDEFFSEVGYVIVSEPSRVLATAQLGMSLVASRCAQKSSPTYVAFDHNHDGLVDSLSHLFRVPLTDVVATQAALGATSDIVWRAEGGGLKERLIPGIARYLGTGTELGVLALKYHVSEVEWAGGAKFPVTDMNWIAAQYYEKINAFAELDPSQRAFTKALRPRANPTGLTQRPRRFLIAEDEFSNVYETLRMFSTRSTESGFVNVISEDYLLRDYMANNREVFSSDAKAIPSLAPDSVNTERNCILRMLLELSAFGLTEEAGRADLESFGHVVAPTDAEVLPDEPSPFEEKFGELVERYTGAALPRLIREPLGTADGEDLAFRYSLEPSAALAAKLSDFGPAFFIAEDGVHGRHIVSACLRAHAPQMLLPGQFLTYDGRYYEVLGLDYGSSGDIRLRRAADHITGRPAYLPLRSFRISDQEDAGNKPVAAGPHDIKVRTQVATVDVQTHGYLEASARSNVQGAKKVVVEGVPLRSYAKKEVLRIELPGADPAVAQTIALIMNELFVTLFPLGHQFIAAMTPERREALHDLLPGVDVASENASSAKSLHQDAAAVIYVVEDSPVDLGLTVAVERNWSRIADIVADYLDWNASPVPDPELSAVPGVRFEGDSEQSLELRAARIAQAEATGVFFEPKVPWWTRAWRTLKKKLEFSKGKRSGADGGTAVAEEEDIAADDAVAEDVAAEEFGSSGDRSAVSAEKEDQDAQ